MISTAMRHFLEVVRTGSIAQAAQQLAPGGCTQATPVRPLKRLLRGLHRVLDITLIGIWQFSPGEGRGGVEALEGRAGYGVDPLAVDAHLKAGEAHATIPFIGGLR